MVTIKKADKAALEAPTLVAEETKELDPAELLFPADDSGPAIATETEEVPPSFDFGPEVVEAAEEAAPTLLLPPDSEAKIEVTSTSEETTEAAELMVIEPPVGSVGRFPTLHAPNTTKPAPISMITDPVPVPEKKEIAIENSVSATSTAAKDVPQPKFPTPAFPAEESSDSLFKSNLTTQKQQRKQSPPKQRAAKVLRPRCSQPKMFQQV